MLQKGFFRSVHVIWPELCRSGCLHVGKAENPAASLSGWLKAPGSPNLALKDWRIPGELLVFARSETLVSVSTELSAHSPAKP